MLENIWDSISQASGRRWIIISLAPAFALCAATALVFVLWTGLAETLTWWDKLTDATRAFLLLAAAIVVILSALVLDALGSAMLSWAEGYWDDWPLFGTWLRRALIARHAKQLAQLRERRQRLYWKSLAKRYPLDRFPEMWTGRQPPEPSSEQEEQELLRLDKELHELPSPGTEMPTQLGNLMCAAEQHALRYGLDAVVTFPRLYPLLPEALRSELNDARTELDASARAILVAILFTLGWSIIAVISDAWVPIAAALAGVLSIWLSYRAALRAVSIYGELLRSGFDLHRFALYEALRFPVPIDSKHEVECGQELTAFLWRGPSALEPSGTRWAKSSSGGKDGAPN